MTTISRHERPVTLQSVYEESVAAVEHVNAAGFNVPAEIFYDRQLSDILGCRLYVASDIPRYTGAFKERGAINAFSQLSDQELARGIGTVSAGSFGLAVGKCAEAFGVDAALITPTSTPECKVQKALCVSAGRMAVKKMGADFDEAARLGYAEIADLGYTPLHPFDDPHVIAGQGTLGHEIVDELGEDLDHLIFPVGGGGLGAGLASVFSYRSPKTVLSGIEPIGADSMGRTLSSGRLERIEEDFDVTVDGAATRMVCERTFSLFRSAGIQTGVVDLDALYDATTLLRESGVASKQAELAGALSLAYVLRNYRSFAGRNVCIVLSGGNLDDDRYRNEIKRSSAVSIEKY